MDISALRQELTEYCSKYDIYGQIRVTLRDDVLLDFRNGLADREKGVPFSGDSVFRLFSISKQFCSMAVMKLYENGLLDLYSHPGKYLPEARDFNEKVTLWNLLHHTSGIPDCVLNEEFYSSHSPADPARIREDIRDLSHYPQSFEPDTSTHYINSGFVMAALIVENISGETYESFMQKEIFEPMGMSRTRISVPGIEIPHMVQGYGKSLRTGAIFPVNFMPEWEKGAGDAVGTVSDLYMLNVEIKSPHVLKKSSWDMILKPDPRNSKGMGCTITDWHGHERISHNGTQTGFRALHYQMPEDDLDIIILSNSGYHNEARFDISEIIRQNIYGE